MRTIKFRAKRVDSGEWMESASIQNNPFGNIYLMDSERLVECYNKEVMPVGIWIKVIPETVGQYWRNINGEELYDGDVFESTIYEDRPKWVVQYREDEARFCIAHPDELKLKYIYCWQSPDKNWWKDFENDLEVIGNIYDNPELIK